MDLSWIQAFSIAVFTISKPFVQDEELEREKLEQLALLQELEEQKAKLEQLLKSQQESKRIHVTREEDQPESFISDHEVSSAETTDVCSFLINLTLFILAY